MMLTTQCCGPRLLPIFLALVAFGSATSAQAALIVTPLDSSVRAYTEARAAFNEPVVPDEDFLSQGVPIQPLSAFARSESLAGTAAVITTAEASAIWSDADHATIRLSNLGWSSDNVENGRAAFSGEFTYRFLAVEDGVVDLIWHTTVSASSAFGLDAFRFTLRDDHGSRRDSGIGLGQQATYTQPIHAGVEYTVEINTFLNVSDMPNINGGLGDRDAHQSGIFDLQFNRPIPEPSLLVFAILATPLILWFVRRRMRVLQTPPCLSR